MTSSTKHKQLFAAMEVEETLAMSSQSINSGNESDFNVDLKIIESVDNDILDNDMEPLATEEEARAYEVEVTREQNEQHELSRRFNGEISVESWYVNT